jgi:hypothetical protein
LGGESTPVRDASVNQNHYDPSVIRFMAHDREQGIALPSDQVYGVVGVVALAFVAAWGWKNIVIALSVHLLKGCFRRSGLSGLDCSV